MWISSHYHNRTGSMHHSIVGHGRMIHQVNGLHQSPRWHNYMEIFSSSLTGPLWRDFHNKGLVRRSFDICFLVRFNKLLKKTSSRTKNLVSGVFSELEVFYFIYRTWNNVVKRDIVINVLIIKRDIVINVLIIEQIGNPSKIKYHRYRRGIPPRRCIVL